MAKDQGIVQTNLRPRTPLRGGRSGGGSDVEVAAKKPFNPVQFWKETQAEAKKITWTTWKETWITSVMVGIMVVVTATFFFGVDTLLSTGISLILKLAGGE